MRRERDFYPTPWQTFKSIIPYLPFVPIWEPCQGDSRLVRWMREAGHKADGDDLAQGYDFLKDIKRRACIVTNPPFSLAEEFAMNANLVSPLVYMLLPLGFLASQKRREFWQRYPLSALFPLSQRPSFTDDGKTDACDYAWFFWDRNKTSTSSIIQL